MTSNVDLKLQRGWTCTIENVDTKSIISPVHKRFFTINSIIITFKVFQSMHMLLYQWTNLKELLHKILPIITNNQLFLP